MRLLAKCAKIPLPSKTRHLLIAISVLYLIYCFRPKSSHERSECREQYHYNRTYPLTPPLVFGNQVKYRVAVISDLDRDSKQGNVWVSRLLRGFLIYYKNEKFIRFEWDSKPLLLQSKLTLNGRGMELSELAVFNGRLYSCDDRTGIVYELRNDMLIPWVILTDGNGSTSKEFKCEWIAIKGQNMYVGSLGKEWTSVTGELENYNPQWVKVISVTGEVKHIDWRENYLALRSSVGIYYPGYMIHESAAWSNIARKWFFLPRRASHSAYNEIDDETKGTNVLLTADESFSLIESTQIGSVISSRGFSSFKFLPNSDDKIIIAIKSEEYRGEIASYITAFTVDGEVLLDEQKIDQIKYEGFEFI
ncbi:soluble calcium-activated nucleotidase 1-like protein [Dinothrombium tinctorium]|uniref:Apyrase n=1 Tax=Dinothrombium tinctorium TaxID=1965070 RepID=A0A443RD52_9ACAR|nr:soluble calcium-activated nucleotidase 1-like protein [Dinothrombium tinctorium]